MKTRRAAALAASALIVGLVSAAPPAQAAITPDGWYTVTALHSGKCVDARSAGTANGPVVQQLACQGTGAQSSTTTPVGTTPPPPPPGTPDFGPNVVVFDPSMSSATIQSRLNGIFSQQERNQFGSARFAVMFKPGNYSNDV